MQKQANIQGRTGIIKSIEVKPACQTTQKMHRNVSTMEIKYSAHTKGSLNNLEFQPCMEHQ